MFRFCVLQAVTLLHEVWHEWCVVVFPFENRSRLFSNRTEKETRQQTEEAAVHCGGMCSHTFVYILHVR
jgi:hypothetical protein